MESVWYTVKQVEKILDVTNKRITQLLRAGILEGYKIGRKWHVSAESVANYIINCNNGGKGNE